ncbi:cell migration-inducing and hyaluronan-binding protein-like [Gambusia affinis]|uniref:cell migration-inducing and hyaluronan-binding protein-like n=1 Tax=Gambusia affinis TaxID=33528 RepID=UPI001CDD24FF|nr:cell migration-inducing and hyaluronan-binding protein-like [Gambusia affinis]
MYNFLSPIFPRLQCHHPTNLQCWTQWFEIDNPSRNGDRENLAKLLRRYPGKICPDPLHVEARTVSGLTPEEAGDIVKIDTNRGFICRKRDQPDRECEDYKVRFSCPLPYCGNIVCWTKWYDRDDPSVTSDWESLGNLQSENPGEICKEPLYIETVTTDTLSPVIYTGEEFFVCNPKKGFVCRQKDKMSSTCRDYRVRFGCPCGN